MSSELATTAEASGRKRRREWLLIVGGLIMVVALLMAWLPAGSSSGDDNHCWPSVIEGTGRPHEERMKAQSAEARQQLLAQGVNPDTDGCYDDARDALSLAMLLTSVAAVMFGTYIFASIWDERMKESLGEGVKGVIALVVAGAFILGSIKLVSLVPNPFEPRHHPKPAAIDCPGFAPEVVAAIGCPSTTTSP